MIDLAAIQTSTRVLVVISESIMMTRRQTTELDTEWKRYGLHNRPVDAIAQCGDIPISSFEKFDRLLFVGYHSNLSVSGACRLSIVDYACLNGSLPTILKRKKASSYYLQYIYRSKDPLLSSGRYPSIVSFSEQRCYLLVSHLMWKVISFACYHSEVWFLVYQTS